MKSCPKPMARQSAAAVWLSIAVICVAMLAGCERRRAMYDQPRYEPFDKSDFFEDGRANRLPVPGTVARGFLKDDELLWNAMADGQPTTTFPFPVTKEVIKRGQMRYEIHCSPCHSSTGDGWGMVVQRGLKRPPSLHEARLRAAPISHFFNVITHGIGVMNPYAPYIRVQDRWAIIAYVRALQLSQNASINDVPSAERVSLESQK